MRFVFIINDIYVLDPTYEITYFCGDQVNFIDFKLQDIEQKKNLLINLSENSDNDSDNSINVKNNDNNRRQIFKFEKENNKKDESEDEEKESIDIENNNKIEHKIEIPNIIEISNNIEIQNNISKTETKKNKKKKHKKNNKSSIEHLSEMLAKSPRKTYNTPSKNFWRRNKFEKENLSVTHSSNNCDITDEKKKIKRIKTRSILKDRSIHRKLNDIENVNNDKKVSFGVIKYSY